MSIPTQLDPRTTDRLAEGLRIRLTWMPYLPCAICIDRILTAMGYRQVRRTDRLYLKGRTAEGGFDMLAKLDGPHGTVSVVIQIKRYDRRKVARRAVDELRGVMDRVGAAHGILITTSSFSEPALRTAASLPGRPVFMVDGRTLGKLMVEHRIGIVEQLNLATGKPEVVVDVEGFERLERAATTYRRLYGALRRGDR